MLRFIGKIIMSKNIIESNRQKMFLLFLGFNIFILLFLRKTPLDLLIVWVPLPIYIGYGIVFKAWRTGSKKKLWEGYGFLIVSLGFTYFYHFSWFFDWGGSRTGGSTSALMFLWGPIWATLLGYIGYFIGSFEEDNAIN